MGAPKEGLGAGVGAAARVPAGRVQPMGELPHHRLRSASPGHSCSGGSRPGPHPAPWRTGGAPTGMVENLRRGRLGRRGRLLWRAPTLLNMGPEAPSGGAGSGPRERSRRTVDPFEPPQDALQGGSRTCVSSTPLELWAKSFHFLQNNFVQKLCVV